MNRFRGNAPGFLVCLRCGRPLAHVGIGRDLERSVLQLEGPGGERVEVLQGRVECPDCHAVRAFYASPAPSTSSYAPPVLR